jgi:hypothetical protein
LNLVAVIEAFLATGITNAKTEASTDSVNQATRIKIITRSN